MIWLNKPANEPTADENSGSARKTVRKMLAIIPILAAAVLCYAVTVFAWFQDSLVNSGNIIQAGRFSAAVEITQGNQRVWSSAENLEGRPAGILGCDEQISGISPGEAVLRITNNSDSTLSLQYAMLLTEGDLSGPEVELAFEALWDGTEETASQDNEQVLQPGWSATYTFTVNEGVSALYLQFRTAFVANSAPTFATADNAAAHSIQRGPTAAETTTSSQTAAASASASPTTSSTGTQLAPTSKAETTGQTEAAPTSGEAVSTTTGSAAAGGAPATETGGSEPAEPSEAAAQTASTDGSASGETTTTAVTA